MKIRKVKWQNHPVLGNLEMEFMKDDGTVYNNIILIGENGSGKTSVMESISTFLNMGSFDEFDYLEFEANGQVYKALHKSGNQRVKNFFRLQDNAEGTIEDISRDRQHDPERIATNPKDPRSYGCAISKARANYKTDKIQHTTTSELDGNKHSDDDSDNFTSLKQMFVDIVAQDEHEYMVINEGKNRQDTMTVDQFRTGHSKQYRFVRAFDAFFDDRGLKYGEVDNVAGSKEILFEKMGHKIPIDSLSTGEKQIVYRGMFLLRNLNVLSEAVIFVDEPELSMHPRWQAKILPFYEGLFKDAAGSQLAQMFFATHSNYVVDSSFAEPAEHLVLLLDVDEHGAVSYHKVDDADRVLPRVSPAEINYLAFRLPSIEYHVELYGYLQIKAGLATVGRAMNVKETDNYIKNQPQYNAAQHFKRYTFHDVSHNKVVNYDTLCTYIRNCIDHPDHNVNPAPSQNEMECSIELLRELCR